MRFNWFHLPTAVAAGCFYVGIALWQWHRCSGLNGSASSAPNRKVAFTSVSQPFPSDLLPQAINNLLGQLPPSRPGVLGDRGTWQWLMSWVSSQSDARLWELAKMEPDKGDEDGRFTRRLISLARTTLSLRHPHKAIEFAIERGGTTNDIQALEAWAARDSEAALQWLEDNEAVVERPKLAYRSVWAGLARYDVEAALILAAEREDLPRAMSIIARSIQSEAQAAMALKRFFPYAIKLHAEEARRKSSGPRDLRVTEILRSIVMRPLLTAGESIRLIDTKVPEVCRDDVAANFFSHQFPHSAPELLEWLDVRSRVDGNTDWIRRAFGSIDREHLDTAVSLVEARREAVWYSVAMASLGQRLERMKR